MIVIELSVWGFRLRDSVLDCGRPLPLWGIAFKDTQSPEFPDSRFTAREYSQKSCRGQQQSKTLARNSWVRCHRIVLLLQGVVECFRLKLTRLRDPPSLLEILAEFRDFFEFTSRRFPGKLRSPL